MWGYSAEKLAAGGNPIALCEGAMPTLAIAQLAPRLANRRVLWLLDNTAALHSFVRGNSGHSVLDRSIAVTKFYQCHYGIDIWFEYVESEANWADGISR